MAEASTSSRPQSPSPSAVQTPLSRHPSLQDVTPRLRKRSGEEEFGMDVSDADDEEHEMYTAIPAPSMAEVSSQETQLPTPRTGQAHTTTLQPFFPSGVGSPESPLTHALSLSLGRPVVGLRRMRSRSEETLSLQVTPLQPITPAASPARRGSASSSGHSTVLQSPISEASIRTKTDLSQLMLAPAPDIPLSRVSHCSQSTPEPVIPLDLSSPFTERPLQLDAGDTTMDEASDGEMPATDGASSSPIVPIVDENGQAGLVAEVPTTIDLLRPAGGELERLRTEATTREVARQAELETRRPDYLKRVAKEDTLRVVEKELVDQGLAIAETPARGRRLQFFDFQATSAESFEHSLMTNGYGTYSEPRTPLRPVVVPDGLGNEALAWLAYNSPLPAGGVFIPFETPGGRPTEKEMKKRKRLEAFQSSTARACAKLYTGQVEGLGRVLLNVPPEDAAEVFGTPAKKRNLGKKKRATPVASEKRIKQEESHRDNVGTQLLWLDSEKPWAARREEREGEMRAQEENRMKWIERYLSHDTDSDERHESDDDDDDFPMSWDEFSGKPAVEPPRPGKGKSVPLKTDPAATSGQRPMEEANTVSPIPQHTRFTSDPADARSAFLGKRAVRAIALRKHRQQSASRENQSVLGCECGEDGEDKQAVLCDDCNTWYHLECIGIRDESELGGSEEPWFCPRCEADIEAGAQQSMMQHREPNFFVAEQSPVRRNARSDVSLYSSSSPMQNWGPSGSFRTPMQGSSHGRTASKSRKSMWDNTPRGSTSKVAHMTTPGTGMSAYTHHAYQYGSSPPSLPSLRQPTFATPKNPSTRAGSGFDTPDFGVPWPINTGSIHTPRNSVSAASTFNNRSARYPNIGSTGYNFAVEDSGGFLGHTGPMQMYAWCGDRDENDTPISRRAPPGSAMAPLAYNALTESPLAQKGQGFSQTLRTVSGSRAVPSLQSPASPLAHASRRS